MEKIISRNPIDGSLLAELNPTPPDELPSLFEKAKTAQASWRLLAPKKRAEILLNVREALLNHIEDFTDLISKENGKPNFESMVHELLPAVNLISYYTKQVPGRLKDKRLPLVQFKHRTSCLNYFPIGVVAVITPWNFPFFLPLGEITMALLAGNAVIFKPSEDATLTGLKIQELFDEAGLPPGLLQTIIGDGATGAAIINQKPGKIFFTGSAAVGRKVAIAAAEHLIPVNLELGGNDAMIVLRDADLDYATSAALWGGFSNSGQICASVERIIIHENVAEPFMTLLKQKLATLRLRTSGVSDYDLSGITAEKYKEHYKKQIIEAKESGARFIAGGDTSSESCFLEGTIVTGPTIEQLNIYNEETFGPAVSVTTFKSLAEAVKKANASSYGLQASIITRDFSQGELIARQLEVGTVTINEVTYVGALPEVPWHGIKQSGSGIKHSADGIFEFVHTRHIQKPKSRLFMFKSPWWFPYTPYQFETFRKLLDLYRRHWTDRIRTFPLFVWNLAQFFKREKRL